jgi:hypothetical protein
MPNDFVEPNTARKPKIRRGKYGPVKKRTIRDSRLFSTKRRPTAKVVAEKRDSSGPETR